MLSNFNIFFSLVYLIETGNSTALGKIGNIRTKITLAGFTFHGKDRLFIFNYHKINFALYGIANKFKGHFVTLGIL